MRFLFRGMVRETGKPVEGHVEAPDSETAYTVLGENGIVTESLRDDPKPLNMSPTAPAIPQFADALESALDSSSSQVAFDDLTERYRGKKVWVIDRDKIRHRVAQVVDSTLATSEANLENGTTARQRVATAIQGLFNDTRNIATQHNADSVPAMRMAANNPAAPEADAHVPMSNEALNRQIATLTSVVQRAEGLVAALSTALRTMSTSGIEPRRRATVAAMPASSGGQQNEVLLEIFKSNLDLRHSMNPAAVQQTMDDDEEQHTMIDPDEQAAERAA